MARRSRKKNESLFEEILTLVTILPWWGGPLVAALVYGFLALIVPAIFQANVTDSPVTSLPFNVFSRVSITIAPLVAGIILIVSIGSTLKRWFTGRTLDTQTGAESLRELNWREFERLLAEAFRREGYMVEPSGGNAPDIENVVATQPITADVRRRRMPHSLRKLLLIAGNVSHQRGPCVNLEG